jgi:hypothetical protein
MANLYCGDGFFQDKVASDNAIQANGAPATNANGNVLTIGEVYATPIAQSTQNGLPPRIVSLGTFTRVR